MKTIIDTKENITEILTKIQKNIKSSSKKMVISRRDKNNIFLMKYGITIKILKDIILNLTVDDFAKILENHNDGFENEKLYVFAPIVSLTNTLGEKEKFQLYLKINFVKNIVIVISCHKAERNLKYAFKG